MNFLINDAWAAAEPAAGSPIIGLLPLIIIFVVFYFLLIRPQTKRAKEHREMVTALAKGDEVVTSGGLLGRINNVGDQFIDLELGEGHVVKVQKHAVSALVPKGTLKNA